MLLYYTFIPQATVSITITDVNDNKPQFKGAPYTLKVPENTTVGTRLLQVEATDADLIPYKSAANSPSESGTPGGGLVGGAGAGAGGVGTSQLQYSIAGHASNLVRDTFRVDPISGQLELTRELDYDRSPIHVYNIPIVVSDGMPPASLYPQDTFRALRASFHNAGNLSVWK